MLQELSLEDPLILGRGREAMRCESKAADADSDTYGRKARRVTKTLSRRTLRPCLARLIFSLSRP